MDIIKSTVKKISQRQEKAAIALTTVIVISAILLLSGTTIVLINIDLARATKSSNATILNRLRSKGCFEEVLIRLKNDSSFTGDVDLAYDSYTCTASVSNNANPQLKDILVSSTSGEYHYEESHIVNISTDPIQIVD